MGLSCIFLGILNPRQTRPNVIIRNGLRKKRKYRPLSCHMRLVTKEQVMQTGVTSSTTRNNFCIVVAHVKKKMCFDGKQMSAASKKE